MNNNIAHFLFLFLVNILLLSACNNDDPIGQNVVFDIEDEFELNFKESLSNNEKLGLSMDLISLREFDCTNYGISTLASIFGGDRIRVSVADLLVPEICEIGTAPAVGNAFIGNLETQEYELTVTLVNEIENQGTLVVYDDYYEININEENGLTLPHTRLNKIPAQRIWGYVGYENTDIDIANELMEDMLQFLKVVPHTSGNYGHFQVTESGVVVLPDTEVIKTSAHQTFLFELNGTVDELRRKVEDTYCPQYQGEIDLKIFVSEGTVIECL